MKGVLFTTDWHIGASWGGRDRTDELERGVLQLAEAAKGRVDSVVVGGDVFDSFRWPGRSGLELASGLFSALLKKSGAERLFIVKGNHDWGDIGAWPTMMFGSDRVLSVFEKPGVASLGDVWLSAVPHLRRHAVVGSFDETVAGALPPDDGKKILLCGHMAVEGSAFYIGGKDAEPCMTSSFLSKLDGDGRLLGAYFGHIHVSGDIDGVPKCRYIGTPLRHSFSEEKSVPGGWIVTPDDAQFIEIENAVRFTTVRAFSASEAAVALESVERTENTEREFVRVVLPEKNTETAENLEARLSEGFSGAGIILSVSTREDTRTLGSETSGEGVLPAPEETLRASLFDVGSMLESYFEESLPEGSDPAFFASLAGALLDGTSVEDAWSMLKAKGGACGGIRKNTPLTCPANDVDDVEPRSGESETGASESEDEDGPEETAEKNSTRAFPEEENPEAEVCEF